MVKSKPKNVTMGKEKKVKERLQLYIDPELATKVRHELIELREEGSSKPKPMTDFVESLIVAYFAKKQK